MAWSLKLYFQQSSHAQSCALTDGLAYRSLEAPLYEEEVEAGKRKEKRGRRKKERKVWGGGRRRSKEGRRGSRAWAG
jgi:hypothetical protein